MPDWKVKHSEHNTSFERGRFLLEIEYWSKKILITRPCLCKLERRIRNQSDLSTSFDAKAAKSCCDAALEIAKLCPDEPSSDFIYSNGPWWAMVHISKCLASEKRWRCTDLNTSVMQSIAVLLLEMTYKAQDPQNDASATIPSIKKLIRWLQAMQNNDLVAERAYEIIRRILQSCAPPIQAEANELLASFVGGLWEAHVPQNPPDAFAAQATDDWQQADASHDPVASSGFFVPGFFQQQFFDPMSDCQSDAYMYASMYHNTSMDQQDASQNQQTEHLFQQHHIYQSWDQPPPQ